MPEADAQKIQAPASVRAGDGARTVAILIDLLLINLLIAVVGLAFTGATDGRVRVANTVLNSLDCTSPAPWPSGFTVPVGFDATAARRCTRSFLGFEHDWMLVVDEKVAADESPDDRRQIIFATDRTGQPVQAFYLDHVILAVLAAYLLVCEWRFGATLGKRLAKVQVRSLDGAPLAISQLGKRVLLRLFALLPLGPDDRLIAAGGAMRRFQFKLVATHEAADFGMWFDVLKVLALAYIIGFFIAAYRRSLPLHDLWAGTEVIRSDAAHPGTETVPDIRD